MSYYLCTTTSSLGMLKSLLELFLLHSIPTLLALLILVAVVCYSTTPLLRV